MLAARAVIDPEAWAKGVKKDLVVLAPENTHYSIARAISITGLGSEAIVPIPTNQYEVVESGKLEALIERQRDLGKEIMAVVANACATATGLYDPVDEMADVCLEKECWFHVDSPHGATALLSGKYTHLLKGIQKADSMIWDAHKMMQTSSLSTGVLFKNKKHYHGTFTQKASYLIHEKENPGYDVLPYQIECTKTAIATKLFFVLAAIGEKGMSEFIEKLYDNSRNFSQIIDSRPGFSCDIPVESNIICFRYKPDMYDQLKLREKLIKTGEFYITSTEVKGLRYLRLVVMHQGTTSKNIEALLDKIEEISSYA
jgi:L-2,4-diaminobutyrate decarboxylase